MTARPISPLLAQQGRGVSLLGRNEAERGQLVEDELADVQRVLEPELRREADGGPVQLDDVVLPVHAVHGVERTPVQAAKELGALVNPPLVLGCNRLQKHKHRTAQ